MYSKFIEVIEIQDLKNSCCKYISERERWYPDDTKKSPAGRAQLRMRTAFPPLLSQDQLRSEPSPHGTTILVDLYDTLLVPYPFPHLLVGFSFFCLFCCGDPSRSWRGAEVKSSQVVGGAMRLRGDHFLFFQNFSSMGVPVVWGTLKILLSNKTTRWWWHDDIPENGTHIYDGWDRERSKR